jgi:hypothetical protein
MQKKVLSEIDIYSGEVKIPLDYKINRKEIFSSILYNCFIELNKFKFDNTFKVNGSQPLGWYNAYIIEHASFKYNLLIETINQYGILLYPGESLSLRNENNLNPAVNYTVLYGIEIPKNSTKFVLNFKDRNITKTYTEEIYDNKFIIFPSTEDYYLTKNNSSNLICCLVSNYQKK